MASEVNKYKIGLFVVIGLALAVIGILVLGANRFFVRTERLVTYFEESVQGLNDGSAVKFRGVPVGRVDKIYVAPHDDLVAVEFDIFPGTFRDDAGRPICIFSDRKAVTEMVKSGMRIRLNLAGITGLKYLEFDRLDPAKYQPRQINFAPPHTYIPSAPSSLKGLEMNVTTAVARLAQVDFEGIGDRVKTALEQTNKVLAGVDSQTISKGVEDILARAREAVADIRQITGTTRDLVAKADLENGVKDARETLASLKSLTKRLDTQGATLLEQVQAALAGLQDTGRKAASLAENLDRQIANADVAGTTRAVRDTFERSGVAVDKFAALRDDARHTLRELDETLRTLRRFVDYMERNPNALIAGKREPNP
jgi:ABC-type transporter Mla subunit MlaD